MLQKNYNTSQDKIKRAPTLTASARLITVAKHPGNVGTLIAVPLIFPVLAVLVLVYSVSTTNTLAEKLDTNSKCHISNQHEETEKPARAYLHVAGHFSWTNFFVNLLSLMQCRFHPLHLSV